MLKDYDWINAEKHLFGLPNSAYDFKTNNPKEAGQRLQKLQEMKEKLGRNVNMRAMNVLTEAEERVSRFSMTVWPQWNMSSMNKSAWSLRWLLGSTFCLMSLITCFRFPFYLFSVLFTFFFFLASSVCCTLSNFSAGFSLCHKHVLLFILGINKNNFWSC